MAILPHCVPANVQKELDYWVDDGKISTWDGMRRAFRKEEVDNLLYNAQRRFKAVVPRMLAGHIRVADWHEFRRAYRRLRRYAEDRSEELEAARMYDMLPYKWGDKIEAEEQNTD